MAKKDKTTPTGVNQGLKQGLTPDDFKSRVICKKCGKDIEFTLGSELFVRCPRCNAKIERDLATENKEAKKIIKFDIFRRSKRYHLHIGFIFTLIALAYNTVGFFAGLFAGDMWWLALVSLPLVLLSYALVRVTRYKSASRKYRFFAWLALILNTVALAAVVITAVPYINEKLMDLYNNNR
jgi:uncharacterized C2H2 Zn-finger protein